MSQTTIEQYADFDLGVDRSEAEKPVEMQEAIEWCRIIRRRLQRGIAEKETLRLRNAD